MQANIIINRLVVVLLNLGNTLNLRFYKIFNVAKYKYFNPKTLFVRIFLYTFAVSFRKQFASALNIQSWED
ncbi:hypothetical protein EAH81_04190 [Flavobacterium pectinovorum]|jgi:hypothetical protein|uniref:Uncharacterized protein n=1 Tax=Flavobacterium pectinovorum TaxID=29533 RepID=A0A502F498_9FLAO|nr:hypothetical protein EAH81_04190 [Flavobacterium pectinovorum]